MWPPAHAIAELSMLVGIGATGAGIIKPWYVEGRIALVVRIRLLLCCVLLDGLA